MNDASLVLFSPAKVNLFLHVLGKLPSGYHEVATLLQAVDWGDTIRFSLGERDHWTCTEPSLAKKEENLVWKAVSLFRRKTGHQSPLSIHLQKAIPMQAGLGGGSSNAATTLWALHRLFPGSATEEDLRQWGGELGADVPFFFSSGTALCTGMGERVTSLASLPLSPFWIVRPPVSVPTPAIYGAFRFTEREERDHAFHADVASFVQGELRLCNDLEEPAFQLFSLLATVKRRLEGQERYPTLMTGSGSAFFTFRSTLPPFSPDYVVRQVQPHQRTAKEWYPFPKKSNP